FRQWNELGIVEPQLHRQLNPAFWRIELRVIDLLLQLSEDLVCPPDVETCNLEISRKRDLKYVCLLVGRPYGLWVRTAERHDRRNKIIPQSWRGIRRREPLRIHAWKASHIGKWRHVHDRHARHTRHRDRFHKFSNARRTVLWLLHRQADEVEF